MKRTMPKSKPEPSSWEAKLQRRADFCEQFVREHHPGMANAHKIKGARPLKPLVVLLIFAMAAANGCGLVAADRQVDICLGRRMARASVRPARDV